MGLRPSTPPAQVTDGRIRRALASAGRDLRAMRYQLAWLDVEGKVDARCELADRAQKLVVRMEYVRRALRARKDGRDA